MTYSLESILCFISITWPHSGFGHHSLRGSLSTSIRPSIAQYLVSFYTSSYSRSLLEHFIKQQGHSAGNFRERALYIKYSQKQDLQNEWLQFDKQMKSWPSNKLMHILQALFVNLI